MNCFDRIRGLVRTEICGAFPAGVLNRCAARGIRLQRVEPVDACCLRATVYEDELPELEAIVRESMCELTVLERRGGSRDRRLLRRRIALLLSLLLVLAALLTSSLFIWEIRVQGNERLSRGEILRALADCGVEEGSFWPGLSVDGVRSRMLTRLPELGWMTVNVSGSRALVTVVERQEKPEIWREHAGAEILAAKTGIVSRLTVFSGLPLVKPGQAVTAGEKLVTGELTDGLGERRHVRARAQVWADTWYERSAVCPLIGEKKCAAHRCWDRFALKIGKKRVNLYVSGGKTLDECDTIVHEYKLGAAGVFSLPLSLIREERVRWETTGAECAQLQRMEQRLQEDLAAEIDGEVLSASFSVTRRDGLLVVTLDAHGLEEIARTAEETSP